MKNMRNVRTCSRIPTEGTHHTFDEELLYSFDSLVKNTSASWVHVEPKRLSRHFWIQLILRAFTSIFEHRSFALCSASFWIKSSPFVIGSCSYLFSLVQPGVPRSSSQIQVTLLIRGTSDHSGCLREADQRPI